MINTELPQERLPRKSFSRGRNAFLLLDTALIAFVNAGSLILAARILSQEQLSDFSLLLLVVTSAVALQRAAFLSPGMASQRVEGKGFIPISWGLVVSVPFSIAGALLVMCTLGSLRANPLLWGAGALAILIPYLIQDVLRRHMLSNSGARRVFWADLLGGGVSVLMLAATWGAPERIWSLVMALSAGSAAGALIYFAGSSGIPDGKAITVKATWKLGRWSGLDNLMSTVANLVPMFATVVVLGYDLAGTYRVLQSALGPLNILATTIITSFGLDSWKLKKQADIRLLTYRVKRLSLLLFGFAVIYVVAAEGAIIWLSDLKGPEVLRIAAVVAVYGVLVSLIPPAQAASLALGRQRSGVSIRIVVLSFSLLVTFVGSVQLMLPWRDPIAAASLFAGVVTLLGWVVTFRRAVRDEIARLESLS